MSNTITAFFKGRVGVAEAVYQNDYGIVINFDSIELPAHFDCYFSTTEGDEAIPGIGADRQVVIPNECLSRPGNVVLHIPIHTGANDSEVEYVIYFKVIGRARPIDDGTPTQMTAIEQALALLQNPITNIEQIVNEALAFTGETFEEMQEDLDEWKTDTEEGLETWKGGVESDFDNLDAQFQTALAAVTVDDELLNIRVGDDNIPYASAGQAVRKQFSRSNKIFEAITAKSLDYKLLRGKNYTWERKTVSSAGYVSDNYYCLLSEFIDVGDFQNEKVIFLGEEIVDSTATYCYVVQYSSNEDTGFITRTLLLHANGTHYEESLLPNCKYVRFIYGHENATEVTMPLDNKGYFDVLITRNTSAEVAALKENLELIQFANLIDGKHVTWTNEIVTQTGEISGSAYTILSNFIKVNAPGVVSFEGSEVLDSKDCYSYVVQYEDDDTDTFITRQLILDVVEPKHTEYILSDRCKYVRFIYGHNTSTSTSMPVSNGQYFKASIDVNVADEIKQKTDTNDEEIFGKVLFDAIQNPLVIGQQINHGNGQITSQSNYYDRTDYIDLNGAKKISYPSPVTNLASVQAGTAFYDSSKAYISGVMIIGGKSSEGTQERVLDVPPNAKYVRVSYWKESYAKQQGLPYPTFILRDVTNSLIQKTENPSVELDVIPLGLHTMPESKGVLNVIKRCRQMTDIKWTPAVDLPRLNSVSGNFEADPLIVYEGVFKAGKEYKGLPYGRTDGHINGYTYAFVGIDVDFETFITSVSNPQSWLCKTSQYSAANHRSVKYAVVCSALSSYAFGWNYTVTQNTPSHSGVSKIADIISNGVRMNLALIKLGDIVCDPGWHIGIVTDIATNDNGDVIVIEVSEANTPGNGNQELSGGQNGGICRRKGWNVEDFFNTWGTFSIYRYSGINDVTYTPNKYVNVGDEFDMMRYDEFPCMPYMGNGFKYKSGYITNTDILISCPDYQYLRVFKDGTEIANSPFALASDTAKVAVGFSEVGDYTAYLCNMSNGADTIKTQKCHWSVIE